MIKFLFETFVFSVSATQCVSVCAHANSVLMTLEAVYQWRVYNALLSVLSEKKHTHTKNTHHTHTHTFTYRWRRSLNCPSHGSPCILTVCLFSQADVIVKLFLKRDTIEKADTCSMARVLPLITNRAVYLSVGWRIGETLLCARPTTSLFLFQHTHTYRLRCTHAHTNTGRYLCLCTYTHTHTPSFKYCPCPNAFYYLIQHDTHRSIEAKETPHTPTHTYQTVCSLQADGICSRRLLFSTTLIWRSLAHGKLHNMLKHLKRIDDIKLFMLEITILKQKCVWICSVIYCC